MMYHEGSLVPTRGPAYPTTIAVALQDSLTEPAEVFLILPLECVTRRTEAKGEDFLVSAPAIHCSLYTLRHIDLSEFKSVRLCSPVGRISTSPVKLADLSRLSVARSAMSSATIHDACKVSTRAGMFSEHPLQRMTKQSESKTEASQAKLAGAPRRAILKTIREEL